MTTSLPSLRIVVGDSARAAHAQYEKALSQLGHKVVGVAADGRELIEICRQARPDVVITDVQMPQLDGLKTLGAICSQHSIPIVITSAAHEPQLLQEALTHPVLAYLVKPINTVELELTLAIVVQRFRELQSLRRETDKLRQQLHDRKLVERAKGLLMRISQLDEPHAFRRLQKLARDKNLKLVEAARVVLESAEVLMPSKAEALLN